MIYSRKTTTKKMTTMTVNEPPTNKHSIQGLQIETELNNQYISSLKFGCLLIYLRKWKNESIIAKHIYILSVPLSSTSSSSRGTSSSKSSLLSMEAKSSSSPSDKSNLLFLLNFDWKRTRYYKGMRIKIFFFFNGNQHKLSTKKCYKKRTAWITANKHSFVLLHLHFFSLFLPKITHRFC